MSILLSAYFPEGIIFAADKNATITYKSPKGSRQHVEPTATKVLAWPQGKALVGFVGLGELAGITLDEWMRIFIAGTREFDDFDLLAENLCRSIQRDYDREFSNQSDISDTHLVIHLGGFKEQEGVLVPVMYHIWNHGDIDAKTGQYPIATRKFLLSEDIQFNFLKWPAPEDYPSRVRERLQRMINERRYLWFNNGANLGAFLVFRDFIWEALFTIEKAGFGPSFRVIEARVAFCKMAVEVFSSYFTHHFAPNERIVGGGVDVVFAEWPDAIYR